MSYENWKKAKALKPPVYTEKYRGKTITVKKAGPWYYAEAWYPSGRFDRKAVEDTEKEALDRLKQEMDWDNAKKLMALAVRNRKHNKQEA